MSTQYHRVGQDHYLIHDERSPEIVVKCFDPAWLETHSTLLPTQGGRGHIRRIELDGETLLLRRYYRGGLVRHFSKRNFFWRSLKQTRAAREQTMLADLRQCNLPCPAPSACHVHYTGLAYQADILIHQIPDSQSLAEVLTRQALETDVWREIGVCIRRFHQAGVNHSDLNAANILLQFKDPDAPMSKENLNKVWWVDFDKAHIEIQRSQWCKQNLARLERSLRKYQSIKKDFNWQVQDSKSLLAGYQASAS